jgi:hypothetical protein
MYSVTAGSLVWSISLTVPFVHLIVATAIQNLSG